MAPRRILQLITLGEVGGAQKVCYDLTLGLLQAGYAVDVACGPGSWLPDNLSRQGIRVIRLPHLRRALSLTDDAAAVSEITTLVKRERYDLVHCHSSKAGSLGRVGGWLAKTPTVFTAHGWAFADGVSPRRKAIALVSEKLAALLCARIVCVSHYDHALALRYHIAPASRLAVIHNGIAEVMGGQAIPAQPGPVKLTMVARFSPQKDHQTLLSAIAQVRGDLVLTLVGDGPLLQSCQKQAEALRLASRVRFLGERHDVAHILADSHIAVLSSHWEGLPITLLEAMRAGLPIVASRVGGVAELVEHGVNGYLVPPRDPEALAAALQRLLDAPEDRLRMGQHSREKMLREFSLKRMVCQTLSLYEQILGSR